MRALTNRGLREVSFRFWLFILLIFLIVFTGGSSRADVQSLAILRPIAMIICGLSLFTIKRDHLQQFKTPILFLCAVLAVPAFQLLPFISLIVPPTPSGQLMSAVEIESALSEGSQRIAMVPLSTRNAVFSLAVPFAVLLLGSQLARSERALLLPVMLIIGLISGFWGLLQVTGGGQSPLYLYDITNNGAAVGLFANRNHQATLLACMFPMLAAYSTIGQDTGEKLKAKGWAAAAIAAFLVPLILVTGSRTGVILSVLGIIFAAMIYRRPQLRMQSKRAINNPWPVYAATGMVIISLGAITFLMSRAVAFSRFKSRDAAEDLRFQIWGPIAKFATEYLPFGSGAGSFATTYKVHESTRHLTVSYVNQAHNDFVDVYLTTGILGVAIILLAIFVTGKMGFKTLKGNEQDSQSTTLAKTGFAIFIILAMASLTDYPLRIPTLAAFLSICMLWLFGYDRDTMEKTSTN